jgi:predicted dehydrogenase
MNFGIIGYGLIGKKRLKALQELKVASHIRIYDPYFKYDRISSNIQGFTDYDTFNKDFKPDFIIISVPHNLAYQYMIDYLDKGTKILVEKPFCESYKKSKEIFDHLLYPDQLHVGFNYRFYNGVASLITDTDEGKFGELISVNMNIGYGGKPEDKSSWKLNPSIAGVGSLLDPGIHMLDLLGLIFSNLTPICGTEWSGFWNTGIVEDTHLILKDDIGCTVTLESSLVKWKNTFRIEVNGTEGYGIVEGRGGNYGEQVYTTGKKWGWMNSESQKKSEEVQCKTDCETSFSNELDAILGYEDNYLLPPCDAINALKTMALYDECLKVIK